MDITSGHLRSADLHASEEFAWALVFGFVFTFSRWLGNRIVLGQAFVTQDKALLRQGEKVFEETWLAILSFGFVLISWIVFLNNDVGASIFNTHPMIRGWPLNFVTYDAIYLIRIETGWYFHQLSRGWTASGVPIDSLMFYHHVGTLVIILFCYLTNLLLLGVLTLGVFNISNPFLHMSKIAHTKEWPQAKRILFTAFGTAFFFSRVVMFPVTVMKIGYVDAYKEDYKSFGTNLILFGNIMMLVLYALQIFWMAKIIRVLYAGKTGSTPRKSGGKKTAFSQTKPLNGNSKEN